MPEPSTNPQRAEGGKFLPGRSGNPKGRPPGSGSSAAARLRRMIAEHGEQLVKALIEQAKKGDTAAAVALLDRTVARLRPMSEPAGVDVTGDRQAVAERIMTAVSAGELSTETAGELLALIDRARPAETEPQMPDLDKLNAIYEKAMARTKEDHERVKGRAERLGLVG